MFYLFEFCLKNMWNCSLTQQIMSHSFYDYKLYERIDEIQTPGQCDPLSVEDAKIEAIYSNQDDNIDNERVEQNNKSALAKKPNYYPRVTPHEQSDY
jgi:hypothetical protein